MDIQRQSSDREDLERLLGSPDNESESDSDCDKSKKTNNIRSRGDSGLLPKEAYDILQCMLLLNTLFMP